MTEWFTWLEGFSIILEWDAAWVAEGTNGDVSFSGAAEHPIMVDESSRCFQRR